MKTKLTPKIFLPLIVIGMVGSTLFICLRMGGHFGGKIEQELTDFFGGDAVYTKLWYNSEIVYSSIKPYQPKNIDSVMTIEYNKAEKVQKALNKR